MALHDEHFFTLLAVVPVPSTVEEYPRRACPRTRALPVQCDAEGLCVLESIVQWVVNLMEALGAPGVGIAILLETIFPPIPSELVLPLAGFTSTQGDLNAVAAFIWATAGSLVGAWLLYWLGAAVGARRLREIADKIPLTEATDVDKAILWFSKYGSFSVFTGRLIPGVRSLISIPAGVERMPLVRFTAWTLAGSAIWNALLIWLGVTLGANWHRVTDVMDSYSTVIYVIIAVILALALFFLLRRSYVRRHEAPEQRSAREEKARETYKVYRELEKKRGKP